MLLVQVKELAVKIGDDVTICCRVYSLDGKLWVSKPSDLKSYHKRLRSEQDGLRRCFERVDGELVD